MIESEELDRIWRDGLRAAARDLPTRTDPRRRVSARVRRRRHTRQAASAGIAAVLAGGVVVGVTQVGHGNSRVRVAGPGPTTTATPAPPTTAPVIAAVVQVDEAPGGTLVIDLPGRKLGNPPTTDLPSGLVRFRIHDSSPGHELRIEGAPGFDVTLDTAGGVVTRDVRLEPGTYVLYCAIPGHRAAGEEVHLVVGG